MRLCGKNWGPKFLFFFFLPYLCARHCANHSRMVWNPQHCCARWGHVSRPWLAGGGAGSSCCLSRRLHEEKLGACSGGEQAPPRATALLFPRLQSPASDFLQRFYSFPALLPPLPLVSPSSLPASLPFLVLAPYFSSAQPDRVSSVQLTCLLAPGVQ